MAKAKVGDIVKADFGSGVEYGLLVKDGDDKDTVVPLGKGEALAYREPADYDAAGSGLTWHNAK